MTGFQMSKSKKIFSLVYVFLCIGIFLVTFNVWEQAEPIYKHEAFVIGTILLNFITFPSYLIVVGIQAVVEVFIVNEDFFIGMDYWFWTHFLPAAFAGYIQWTFLVPYVWNKVKWQGGPRHK